MAVEFSCIQPSGGEEEALLEACDFTVTVSDASNATDGPGVVFYCSTTSEEENARFCIGQVGFLSTTRQRRNGFLWALWKRRLWKASPFLAVLSFSSQVRIFNDAASRESVSGYPGPYFEDLDDAFQEALDKWLGSLGIDEKLCDFVERYAAQKENGEYIKWLQQLSGLVNKP